jgi:hypothetical protein
MQITVLSTEIVTEQGKFGPTQKLTVNYNDGFKVAKKDLVSWNKPTKPAYNALANAKQGDVFTIDRDDTQYKNWIGATQAPPGATTTTPNKASSAAIPVRSSYETPEERATKQALIVRQSSLAQAINLSLVGAKATPELGKVLELAQTLTDWVYQKGDILSEEFPNDLDVE